MTVIGQDAELRDSSGLRGDWQALRRLIAEEGYVFMRGVLDADEVRAIGRRGLDHLQSAGWIAPGDPTQAPPQQPVRAIKMRNALGDPGYRKVLADAGFNRLPYASAMADVMASILGPAGFVYPFKLPRIVYPDAWVPEQPGNYVHKDYGAVQDMFTCWVPLAPVPVEMGGLAVLPGSQHSSKISFRLLSGIEPGWRTTDYQPGDLLVFHCLTTHAALPNRSDHMRFSAEYRWQLADQPAPRRVVIGPNGGEMWSRVFRRTDWWKPVPQGLSLFDEEGERLAASGAPAPPSRYVSFTN